MGATEKLMQANWVKCGNGGNWCPLETLNLESVGDVGGVYIIWHEGNPARVVRVGQGKITDRLYAHRHDIEMLAYSQKGTLRVTWAAVPFAQRDGVERYLAERWSPLVGDAFPDAHPIAVNYPW